MTDQPKKIKANKKDGQLLIRINSTERDEFIQLKLWTPVPLEN